MESPRRPRSQRTSRPAAVRDGGSVDDGKSTLVGRLLYDTKSVLADQIEAVQRASVDKGLATPDLSLLVDGLRAEREQGITIDVAYRYFATPKPRVRARRHPRPRPVHAQHRHRRVHGGAGRAARRRPQRRRRADPPARRRARAAARAAAGAGHQQDRPGRLRRGGAHRDRQGLRGARHVAGLHRRRRDDPGVGAASATTSSSAPRTPPGTTGRRCCGHLESVPVAGPEVQRAVPDAGAVRDPPAGPPSCTTTAATPARSRPAPSRRATRSSCCRGGARTTVAAVDTADGPLDAAGAGRSVTILLADDIDISRGDLLAARRRRRRAVTSELDATLCWLADKPLRPGARLLLKHGTRTHPGDRRGDRASGWTPDDRHVRRRARPAADQRHRPRRAAHGGPAAGGRLRRRSAPPAASCSSTRRPATRWPPGWSDPAALE